MLKLAARVGWNMGAEQINFTPWHAYQRWLAAGERLVYISYAAT
jgi:hypothetical protein